MPPLLVADGWDTTVFRSQRDLGSDVEPFHVEERYRAWDAGECARYPREWLVVLDGPAMPAEASLPDLLVQVRPDLVCKGGEFQHGGMVGRGPMRVKCGSILVRSAGFSPYSINERGYGLKPALRTNRGHA